jgi:hypothetical protein
VYKRHGWFPFVGMRAEESLWVPAILYEGCDRRSNGSKRAGHFLISESVSMSLAANHF